VNHDDLEQHYAVGGILDAILGALRDEGKDTDHLTPDDLIPVDGFHIGGRATSRRLAKGYPWTPDTRVLDIGCGIGGASRFLAAEHGCRVDGLDLTREYVEVARELTRRTGLDHLVSFHVGNAAALPFEPDTFDVAWLESVQMNVEDKRAFFAGIHRVLKPGGCLLFHEVFAGEGGTLLFPAPWAGDHEVNHLIPPREARDLIEDMGFQVREWKDTTKTSAAWFAARVGKIRSQGGAPPLGTHILMGADAFTKFENTAQNLGERRCCTIEAVLEKTP